MDKIKLTQYVKIGVWLVLRSSLPSTHPESYYQQIKSKGLIPEEFGVFPTNKEILRLL